MGNGKSLSRSLVLKKVVESFLPYLTSGKTFSIAHKKISHTKINDSQQRSCLHFPTQNFVRKFDPNLYKIMKGCVNWTPSCPKINKFWQKSVYLWTREWPIHETFHHFMYIWVKFSYKVLRGKM